MYLETEMMRIESFFISVKFAEVLLVFLGNDAIFLDIFIYCQKSLIRMDSWFPPLS